jgi:hypothetical protein
MTKKSRERKARTNKIKRGATLKRYLAELERAKVPPSVVQQVAPLMAILLGANKGRDNA